MSQPTDIAALRALYAAATPGSWVADHDGDWNEHEAHAYVHVPRPGTGEHYAVCTTEGSAFRQIEREEDEDKAQYFDETGRANMAIVAALHEAAPQIFAELEAGRALVAWLRGAIDRGYTIPLESQLKALVEDCERARDGLVADGQFAEVAL